MKSREAIRTVAAWVMGMAALLLLVTGIAVSSEGMWAITQIVLGGISFGVVGLILTLRTRNVVGWLSLGLATAFGLSLHGYGGLEVLGVAAILLLFPTGRLPSRRWRIASVALVIAGLVAATDLVVGLSDDYSWFVFMACVVPVMVAGAVRIVVDYRRAGGEVRLQLKWVAWVLGIGAALLTLSLVPIPYIGDSHELAGLVLLVGSPVAIAFAVSRYRLYEVDRLVSRTVSYTLVLAAVALTYAATVTVIASQLEGPVAVASATLVAAAMFHPLRRRIQQRVDRRFNRSRFEADQIAAEFSSSLISKVDADEVVAGWLAAIGTTLQPRSAAVWIRPGQPTAATDNPA
ncbi:MAG: hypothetical protein R3246_06180 [Acidimicrobiia bacterium]|nr:hypothetical protein [Acidimicrobiia bacterium]